MKCWTTGRGVRVGAGGRVGTGVLAVVVIGVPGIGVAARVWVGGKGVAVRVAVRVGARVMVARRVAVNVGVGDLGSVATMIGWTTMAVMTIAPKMQPSAVPAVRAIIICC